MVAAHVAGVARLDVRDQAVQVGMAAMIERVLLAPLGADVDAGGDEDLGFGIGRDDGRDIAAIQDRAAGLGREFALSIDEGLTHALMDRDAGGERTDGLAAQSRIVQHGVVEIAGSESVRFMIGITAPLQDGEPDSAIEQAGVKDGQAIMMAERLGDGALAGSGWTVDGDDHDALPFRHALARPMSAMMDHTISSAKDAMLKWMVSE